MRCVRVGIDDDHRWKDSVLNGPELQIWLADGMANGLRPWIAKFGGVVYDKRWIPAVEKFYGAREYALIWTQAGAPTAGAKGVIARLKDAASEGLNVADYPMPDFAAA